MSLNIKYSSHTFPNYINIFAYLLTHVPTNLLNLHTSKKSLGMFLQKPILFKGICHNKNNCSPNTGLCLWFIHFKGFQLKNPNSSYTKSERLLFNPFFYLLLSEDEVLLQLLAQHCCLVKYLQYIERFFLGRGGRRRRISKEIYSAGVQY